MVKIVFFHQITSIRRSLKKKTIYYKQKKSSEKQVIKYWQLFFIEFIIINEILCDE